MKEKQFNNPKLIQALCIGLGFIFFGLGALGATIPVLPTTPFLLLAAFFFARGSKRFHDWFTGTALYKAYLESYMERRVMTRKTKLIILFYSTVMMAVGMLLINNLYARLFVGFCILFMHWYFAFRIKTVSPEEEAAQARKEALEIPAEPSARKPPDAPQLQESGGLTEK